MAFLLAAPIAVADVEGGIGDITGIIGDVEGGVSDAEGATAIGLDIVGDAESAVAVGEGALADTTGVANFIAGMVRYLLYIMAITAIWATAMEAMTKLRTGINNHIYCASTEFNAGFDDSLKVTGILFDCSWDKFIKFWNGDCTRYYITDMIFGLIYGIFIELPIVLIRAIFGIDLQPIVDFVYEAVVVPLNELVYAMSGFYIIKWSDSVTKSCFRCKGTVNGTEYHKTMNEWASTYGCSGDQMRQGLGRFFGTVIPSERWSKWANGQNEFGGDWSVPFY